MFLVCLFFLVYSFLCILVMHVSGLFILSCVFFRVYSCDACFWVVYAFLRILSKHTSLNESTIAAESASVSEESSESSRRSSTSSEALLEHLARDFGDAAAAVSDSERQLWRFDAARVRLAQTKLQVPSDDHVAMAARMQQDTCESRCLSKNPISALCVFL